MQPTVGIKALRAAMLSAATAKLDLAALQVRHGIVAADLADPDYRYPHAAWIDLWGDVERLGRDPGIGLHAAAALPLGHWDVIDYLVGSSETLGEGFAKLERYFPLISTAVDHVLRVGAHDARLVREYRPGASRSRPASEFALASIVLRFRALACKPWAPLRIELAHPPSVATAEYEALFGCPVQFGARDDAIVMTHDMLAIAMHRPEAELCAVLERHATATLAALPSHAPTLIDRVNHALVGELASGRPPVGRIAKRLGVSPRSLQRHLAEAGVAYTELVERARENLARRYLDDPKIGLAEVGFLVGFADVSAFYKAFKRWTGQAPGAYRAQHRRRGPD